MFSEIFRSNSSVKDFVDGAHHHFVPLSSRVCTCLIADATNESSKTIIGFTVVMIAFLLLGLMYLLRIQWGLQLRVPFFDGCNVLIEGCVQSRVDKV
jgi:hypothetical protein